MRKTTRNWIAFALCAALMAPAAFGHVIDYLATDIQPQTIFLGQSGHVRLIDPLPPGGSITFNLTLELLESAGGATAVLPATVTFGVQNTGGPEVPVVQFGTPATTLTTTVSYTYQKVSSKIAAFMTPVTAYAPSTPGAYHFKIQAVSGFQGKGLTPGDGIVVHFNVTEPSNPLETILDVALQNSNIIYHTPTNRIIATLKEKVSGDPVPDQLISFYADGGASLGAVATDASGVAVLEYTTSNLAVGDYPVACNYDGVGSFKSTSGSATQCVTYKWQGFLPPVLVQSSTISGLGVGLFQGKVIPVKIRIADYFDAPVTNAVARIYFAQTLAGAAEVQAVAIQPTIADNGNLMRYDPNGDLYILNWNISGLPNGDYNIRVEAAEGGCVIGHWSPIRIGKAGK
jgi:hypothetical protein